MAEEKNATVSVLGDFVKKVLAFVTGGDEANIAGIQKAARKNWEKQVTIAKQKIERTQQNLVVALDEQVDYLKEANEGLDESFVNIDATIKGTDARKDYVEKWEENISDAQFAVEQVEATTAQLKKDAEKAIAAQQVYVDRYVKMLARIA